MCLSYLTCFHICLYQVVSLLLAIILCLYLSHDCPEAGKHNYAVEFICDWSIDTMSCSQWVAIFKEGVWLLLSHLPLQHGWSDNYNVLLIFSLGYQPHVHTCLWKKSWLSRKLALHRWFSSLIVSKSAVTHVNCNYILCHRKKKNTNTAIK